MRSDWTCRFPLERQPSRSSLDGTGMPARRPETADRARGQHDGAIRNREAELVTSWTATGPDGDGRPQHHPGLVFYPAAIETIACRDTDPALFPFARRVLGDARLRRFT